MKKAMTFCLCLVLLLVLSGCGVSREILDQCIDDLLVLESSGLSSSNPAVIQFQEYREDEDFALAVQERMIAFREQQNYDSALDLYQTMRFLDYHDLTFSDEFFKTMVSGLEYYSSQGDLAAVVSLASSIQYYEDPRVTDALLLCVEDAHEDFFSGNSSLSFTDYLRQLLILCDITQYANGRQLFPHDKFAEYILANGKKAARHIWDHGYYDKYRNKYSDEQYWYDPLFNKKSNHGEVGTYQYTLTHTLYGDFLKVSESKYWYQTRRDDSNNRDSAKLYFRDVLVCSFKDDITKFLNDSRKISPYYFYDEAGEPILMIITDEYIGILSKYYYHIPYDG